MNKVQWSDISTVDQLPESFAYISNAMKLFSDHVNEHEANQISYRTDFWSNADGDILGTYDFGNTHCSVGFYIPNSALGSVEYFDEEIPEEHYNNLRSLAKAVVHLKDVPRLEELIAVR